MYVVSTVSSGTARGVYIAINSEPHARSGHIQQRLRSGEPVQRVVDMDSPSIRRLTSFWGPGGVKLFRDGVLVASASAAAPDGHAATMGLGTSAAGSGNYLNGWLNKLVVRRLP
jgi:hypothetical protein